MIFVILYEMRSAVWILFFFSTMSAAQDRARLELEYKGGVLIIEADRLVKESETLWVAQGTVVAKYRDTQLKAAVVSYNPAAEAAVAEGQVEFTRGAQWLRASRGEFDLTTDTGVLYDVEGFTDEQFYLRVRKLRKTGEDTYVAEDGFLTSCDEAVPKWSFTVDKAKIKLDATARLNHTLFRLKNIPLFYLPYVIVPTARKERSSGFMMPTTGNSSIKGRRISESFYLVLGRSADVMLHSDYFSKRGFGYGMLFRTKPNQASHLFVDAFVLNDRLGQGGAMVNGAGETRFANGFRAVADFNLVSNFTFRQLFSDNFYTATRATENSRVFLTNNFQSNSLNFLISREETAIPGRSRNVVIRNTPVVNFKVHGQKLFGAPFYFDFDASAEGLSRADDRVETPGVVQRFDLFPHIYVSLPLFQGLRLTPRLGLRDTFYSDSLDPEGERHDSANLNREYLEFTLDLKGWGLSKIYGSGSGPGWKHLIEPVVRYRYINGIEDFNQIIRFDERDAVANTNEVEYGLFNRVFVKRRVGPGVTNHEWLSFKIAQKFFFDPDFGGAFQPGESNQFFPLNSITGFPYGAISRNSSPVLTLVRFSPQPRISFDMRGDYDPKFRQYRNLSITGFLLTERFSLASTYFVTEKLEPGTFESNQVQAQIGFGNLQRGFSVSTAFSYDAQTSRFLNSLSRASYMWDCCGITVEFQQFDLGIRQERQIRFAFFLKGIGAFGTIKRPESVFPGGLF